MVLFYAGHHSTKGKKMKVLSFLVLSLFVLSACAPKSNQDEANKKTAELQGQTALAQTMTGTWSWSGENESGGYLATIQTKSKVRFELEIMRGAPSYNHGLIEGEFDISGNKGVFQSTDFGSCEIFFDFQKTKVVLTQPSEKTDCGFGYGVYPDGSYILSSHKEPKFSAGDPRTTEQ